VPPVLFGVALLWTVAILSRLLTMYGHNCFYPHHHGLGNTGMEVGPLWWALALGAGFGGMHHHRFNGQHCRRVSVREIATSISAGFGSGVGCRSCYSHAYRSALFFFLYG